MNRIINHRKWMTFAMSLGVLMVPVSGAGEELDWASIGKKAPEELLEMSEANKGALFITGRTPEKGEKPDGVYYLGFFISSDGLGLCPLDPLCWAKTPGFRSSGRMELGTPTVLAIFEDEELALVKFDHKPEAVLTLSEKQAPLGTWVSFVQPPVKPRPSVIAGPVVAHRRIGFNSRLKERRETIKYFSLAVPGAYSKGLLLLRGAPVIDEKGEVVAVGYSSLQMPGQTFVFATPTAGFPEKVNAAVKKNSRTKVPIPTEEQPYDPVLFSEEFIKADLAIMAQDLEAARRYAKAAVTKFPESRYAKYWELMLAMEHWPESGEMAALLEAIEMPEGTPAWERSAHFGLLGEIAMRQGGKEEEVIANLKKADELYPEGMACAHLSELFMKMKKLEEAEGYARRAVAYDPDRIAYWDELQKILFARGKYEEADKLQERVYLLESLY